MTVLLFLIASESSVVAVVCLGLRFTLLMIFFFFPKTLFNPKRCITPK